MSAPVYIKDAVACDARIVDGSFWSDGVTPCWEAEIQCNQGNSIVGQFYGRSKEEAESIAEQCVMALKGPVLYDDLPNIPHVWGAATGMALRDKGYVIFAAQVVA